MSKESDLSLGNWGSFSGVLPWESPASRPGGPCKSMGRNVRPWTGGAGRDTVTVESLMPLSSSCPRHHHRGNSGSLTSLDINDPD